MKLAKSLAQAGEAAHVLVEAEDWSSVDRAQFESIAASCLAGMGAQPGDNEEARIALLSMAFVNPETTSLAPFRDFVVVQPAWKRLEGLDMLRLLEKAELLPTALITGERDVEALQLAWRSGLGTGVLHAVEKP